MSRMLTRVGLGGWFLLATRTYCWPRPRHNPNPLAIFPPVSCHGSRGKAEGVGRVLSGQSADELLTQLRAGLRRAPEPCDCRGLVKAFSDEERAVAWESARL